MARKREGGKAELTNVAPGGWSNGMSGYVYRWAVGTEKRDEDSRSY